ncbi:MAG: sulfatase-like hydrolase/transferase, partial [Elusimicrobia bacterium]|nr:sulfatase-like hydrolase/transferase [Elusimicrobiota bacterium]
RGRPARPAVTRAAGAALLAALLLAARAAAAAPPYNVVLIGLDAARADRFGCYGGPLKASPAVDAFAKTAVVFDRAVSQASWTLPSFASLFTAEDTQTHGLTDPSRRLGPGTRTLAQVLRARGFATAAFASPPFFDRRYGLDRGFDDYVVGPRTRSFAGSMPLALAWLAKHRKKRFFLFLHSNDVHAPYDAPPPYRDEFDPGYAGPAKGLDPSVYFFMVYDGELTPDFGPPPSAAYAARVERIRADPASRAYLAARYQAGIAYADHFLGRLWSRLRALGLDRDTIVVVLSDHGEELGERGRFGHNYAVWDDVTRVPLIVRVPGLKTAGPRVAAQVRLIDVAPTILDAEGIPAPAGFEGGSLLPLLEGRGGAPSRLAFTSSDVPGRRQALFAVGDGRWKLVRDERRPAPALYDLKDDPGETRDVSAAHPKTAARLERDLSAWLARPAPASAGAPQDRAAREALKAAGYLP